MKIIEVFLKNLLLNILLFLGGNKKSDNNETFNNNSKILFIRLNRIGDALVTTPLLHLIKEKLECKIYVLADKKNYFAFNNNPDIDQLIKFNKGIDGIIEVLKFIRTKKIDAVVDLHDDVSTTVSYIITLCKAQNKFGLEKENKKIYTKTIKRLDATKVHVVDRTLELSKLFNVQFKNSDINILYHPQKVSLESIKNFLNKYFAKQSFLLGINISAGSDARFWGTENYKKLIDSINGLNINILILSALKDLKSAKEISGNKHPVYSSESFDKFSAMISQLNLLLTPDTMAVHLASAFNVAVFGIYVNYNTDELIWSPYKSDFECVITKEPNLKNVTFDKVIKKFKPFLEKQISKHN